MLVFMEEEVGTKLSKLSNMRVKIEARLRHNHQVSKARSNQQDFDKKVTECQLLNSERVLKVFQQICYNSIDTQTEINQLIDVQLPTLELADVKSFVICIQQLPI